MPIIRLTFTERLISTPRTWEWQHLKIRKHRITKEHIESWEFHRNYTSLESALMDVANTRIRTSKHEDICKAIQEVKVWLASLSNALTHSLIDDVVGISSYFEVKGENHGAKP